jgi:hypothetical protein
VFLTSAAYNAQHNYEQYEWAEMLYQGGLSAWRDIQSLDNGAGIIRGLVGLAEIAAVRGREKRSGWLFGAADHLMSAAGFYRDSLNERAAQARLRLHPRTVTSFEAAWANGRAATLENVIEQALQGLDAIF